MKRRRFLGGAAVTALAAGAAGASALGASGKEAGPAAADATPTTPVPPLPSATPIPRPPHFEFKLQQVASDKIPAHAGLSTSSVYQAGALMVAVNNAKDASATILGRSYVLQGDNDLAGLIGFGVDDPVGTANLHVQLTDLGGVPLTYDFPVRVIKTQWTRDTIDIPPAPPPDPRAPPPPPPPPDETNLLPTIYAKVTPRKWTGKWTAPVTDMSNITSHFGEERSYNGGPFGGHHSGTDIGVNEGTPIHASNDGTVVLSGLYLNRGNFVIVDHGAGVMSGYGHMVQRLAKAGDVVKQGDLLGYVGMTGLATGPHLHWEISVVGFLVDGLRWLDGSQGF